MFVAGNGACRTGEQIERAFGEAFRRKLYYTASRGKLLNLTSRGSRQTQCSLAVISLSTSRPPSGIESFPKSGICVSTEPGRRNSKENFRMFLFFPRLLFHWVNRWISNVSLCYTSNLEVKKKKKVRVDEMRFLYRTTFYPQYKFALYLMELYEYKIRLLI